MPLASAAAIETKAGTNNLVFEFDGLSNLGASTYMGGIGVRHYLRDDLAVRPGVQIGVSTAKDKNTSPEAKTTATNFGVNVAIEKHMKGAPSVSPYAGLQAGFAYGKIKNEPNATNEAKDTTTNFNFGGILGFEWGFTESLTLGGEYVLAVSVGTRKTETTVNNTTTTTRDESLTRIGIGSARLLLSVAI